MTVSHDNTSLVGRSVFIVEDEYFIAVRLEQVLLSEGANVVGTSSSLEEALRFASCPVFAADIALLDINLNGNPSYPLADYLLEHAIPVVFLSGYSQDDIPEPYRRIARLQKPASMHQLVATLCASLSNTN